MDQWCRSDLEARLQRALTIAEQTIRHFGSTGYTDPKLPGQSFHAEKPVAETAMLLHASSGLRDSLPIEKRVQELASLLVPYARSEGVLVELALRPGLAFKFAVPHILLSTLGFPDPRFDALLLQCAKAQVRNGVDRSPTAELERGWIQSLWNEGSGDARTPLMRSVLAWPLDLLGGLRSDTYAFTHMLMYATNFGRRAVRLPRDRSAILADASALLARYVDSEDYDVAGEVLLAWPFLAAPWTPAATAVFHLVMHLDEEVGVLPGGLVDGSRLDELEGDERGVYALASSYHTAYVMGFICAAALRGRHPPPRTIRGRRYHPHVLVELGTHLKRDQGHYHDLFAALQEIERERLAPFLLDLAIIQSNRRRDYPAMRELIALAVRYGMAASPLCGQAAELLARIAVCAEIVSENSQPSKGDGS